MNTVEFLQTPGARLVFWLAILATLSVIGFYLVRRFRDEIEETETTSSVLSKFRECRHQGVLSESEFRTIKTILAERMQAEINQEDESS